MAAWIKNGKCKNQVNEKFYNKRKTINKKMKNYL